MTRAVRPKRRRSGDADPDLQFLTLDQLDRVIATVPDHAVGRDVIGPVLRVLRWRDVDVMAQRVGSPQLEDLLAQLLDLLALLGRCQ